MPPATGQQLRAVRQRIGHMLFHLAYGGLVDQRPLRHAGLEAVTDLETGHGGGQFGGKCLVDPRLHVQPVGAYAGLAGIAVLAGQRPFDGGIQVGIVKHDEGRVAAQLHRDFLDRAGALGNQLAADFGRAGKAELAHDGAAGQLGTDFTGRAGDDAEHPGRHPGAFGQHGQRQCRQRRLAGGLEHDRAAGRQCRADLAGDHGIGKIPRRDGRADADRLLGNDNAPVGTRRGNGVAVDTLGLFGKPLEITGAIEDFAFGFGQRLALFGGQDDSQIVGMRRHQVKPAAQDDGPLLGGPAAPGRPGRLGGFEGAAGFGTAHFRHPRQHGAGSRIGNGQRGTVVCRAPLATDQATVGQQAGIIEFQHGFILGGRWPLPAWRQTGWPALHRKPGLRW